MTHSLAANGNVTLPEELLACCRALDNKKAENLKILDLRGISSVADYFVIATGTSDPHLKALAATLNSTLKEMDASVFGSQTDSKSGWVVVDAYEVIFHLFTDSQREYYNLEGLWKDAESLEIGALGLTA